MNIDKVLFKQRLREVGATERHLSLISNPEDYQPSDKMEDWLDQWREGKKAGKMLLISGPVQSGKTLLANHILFETLLSKKTCRRITLDDLVSRTTASWNSRVEYVSLVREFRKLDVLIVDDVGKETCGEKLSTTALTKVITEKVDSRGQIILITNVPKTKLHNHYEDSFIELVKTFDVLKTV